MVKNGDVTGERLKVIQKEIESLNSLFNEKINNLQDKVDSTVRFQKALSEAEKQILVNSINTIQQSLQEGSINFSDINDSLDSLEKDFEVKIEAIQEGNKIELETVKADIKSLEKFKAMQTGVWLFLILCATIVSVTISINP